MAEPITVYGASWCPDCRRVKKLLGEHRIPYRLVDTEKSSRARARVVELNKGGYRVPTLVLADGAVLTEPGNSELKVRLGITNRASKPFYDVIIIGGGPAGLTAAIYTGRDALETLIVEQAGLGGQAGLTQLIDNFPGFEKGVGGAELADRLATQAGRFGAEALQGEQTTDIYRDGQYLVVKAANKREFIGRAVLIASGSRFRKLNVPGEEELTGAGVHYCATCDGPFYKGKTVVVVGGGISGFEEGLFLSTLAREVTIVEVHALAKASRILQGKVALHPNMRVLTGRVVRELRPDAGGLSSRLAADGVFVFIGLRPNTEFLPETVRRDDRGFVATDMAMQTTLQGVFAAGDVRAGSTKQAVAASAGAAAALMIRQYLQSIGEARLETGS